MKLGRANKDLGRIEVALTLLAAMAFVVLLPLFSKLTLSQQQTPNLIPGQTATKLADGRMLLLGGESAGGGIDTAAIWDPATNTTTQLSSKLNHARAWHTATVLPDGLILVLGGVGNSNQIVSTAEVFDPTNQMFSQIASSAVTARSHHSATLLSDGQVLIAGGVGSNGQTLTSAELWDANGSSSTSVQSDITARRSHSATLLGDGRVLLWGGASDTGRQLENGELYDPATKLFTSLDSYPTALMPRSTDQPALVASIPLDRSVDVDDESLISLRFSKPLKVETVNANTVSLSGPKGVEKISVVAAENGSLAFLTPEGSLLPGSTYTVSINGAIDKDGLLMPVSGITFSTKSIAGTLPPPTTPPGAGLKPVTPVVPISPTPDAQGVVTSAYPDYVWKGKLKDGKPHSDWQDLPPLLAPPGVTALSGQVLNLAGLPLAGVVLEVEDMTTGNHSLKVHTDETGRFLLTEISVGWQELIIDGGRARSRRNPQGTAVGPDEDHGIFEYGIQTKAGSTTVLPFTIWLPKIDRANAVKIQSPTAAEVVVTNPNVPGLELKLAPGTTIYDHDYNIVKEVSLTPIPTDRTPFPLANNVEVPLYFTAQPGGAYVHSTSNIGARIVYPNHTIQPPGARFNVWHYRPGLPGWYIYGSATVTPDGKQIVPDPGVSVYKFTGAMFNGPNPGGPGPKPCSAGPACKKGDPVAISTGIFTMEKTDLSIPDVMPINVTRTYRPQDSNSRAFGIGSDLPYNWFFHSTNFWFETDIVLPDGQRIRYNCIAGADCSHWTTAVLEHTATQTMFYKSILRWNGSSWDLVMKDGTVYVMADNGPLAGIRDKFGNSIIITRPTPTSHPTRISSPNGRWVDFTYTNGRITQAKDNFGRTVGYQYDGSGRVFRVTDPENGVTEYTYDASHRMLTIKDPRGFLFLTNEYDANNRVTKQTMADGSTYQFAYTVDGGGNITQTDVTDPRGNIERVTFYSDGQIQTQIRAFGTPIAQQTDYERDPLTKLLNSVTDDLLVGGVRRKTTYTYDTLGNMLTSTRNAQDTNQANWVTTTYTYEPVYNQVATITDPLGAGHTTTFAYDLFGNLQTVTDANGNQTSYTYNASGQPLTVTPPLPAGPTNFVYEFGDLVSVTDPLGNVTNRSLDVIGRLKSMTNPLGLTTSYSYDNLSRMTGVTDPLAGPTGFGYDPNSNLLSVSDAKTPTPGVTNYTYDSMDRLQARTDPLAKNESYVYDAAGNLTVFRDRKLQATIYEYDALNRRTSATYADGSSTTYIYDKGNRLTTITDSTAGPITREYDALDRLKFETTPQGNVTYTYDKASNRKTMTVSGQASAVMYDYDNANRLTKITQGTSIVDFGHDNANRRTSLTLPNSNKVEYTYDLASRVTGITYKQNLTTVIGDLTYEYDKAGNRTKIGGSWARTGMPEPITTTSYDANNRQLTFGDKTLAYDDNGNLQSITDSNGTTLYSWNARNQLVGISGPTVNASFVYDGLGRREAKTINGSLTEFLYDGINPVQESSGATVLANILPGLRIDEFLTRTDVVSGETGNFLADALRSPVAVTDSTGAIQTDYTYEAFGRTSATGASNSNSYQFTGRENDGAGLYYYRARYYHPGLQRFLSEDPIGLDGGYTNFYSYVGNNPTTLTDPLGLSAAAGAAAGAEIGAVGGPWGSLAGGILGGVLGAAALAKLIETIGVPKDPTTTPDFSNTPEGCRLNFEVCMGKCRTICDKFERVKCTLVCVAAYVGCMLTNY